MTNRNYAAAALVGGLAGDITGFQLAAPMTDAEAHGASHGSTVAALLTAGAFGVAGSLKRGPSTRVASGAIVGAGILGYPLGLSYVRGAPYRVTAGDVGTMTITGLLGIGAGAALIPDRASPATTYGLLTAGYAAGVIVGDRALVRPFDHSESDARILGLGTAAGALMGLALPVAAQARGSRVFWGAITAGGALGLLTAEQLLAPPRARPGDRSTGSDSGVRGGDRLGRVGVHIAPEAIVMAAMGQRGRHSVLSLSF